ncbi:MAG: Flp pilus assembly protein CpaB [Bacillota bacterium]|nr:MAG: Flp pilus assembly protein CpaB [Bacillota bacterium]
MPRLSGGRLGSGPTLFFALSALAALGAAVLVYQLALSASSRVPVVVARQPIEAYTPLTDDLVDRMLAVVMLPEAAVPSGALQDLAGARGKWTNRSFLPGDVVREGHLSTYRGRGGPLAQRLADPTYGRPEGQAVSLPVDLFPGLASRLQPGDRVDILAYFREEVTGARGEASDLGRGGVFLGPVARRALVLEVIQGDALRGGGELLVALTPEEALRVLEGLSKGRILLALHPAEAEDPAQAPAEGQPARP